MVVYLFYTDYSQKEYQKQKIADSIAYAKFHPRPLADTAHAAPAVKAAADSVEAAYRQTLPTAYFGKADTITVENNKLSLRFATKGAFPLSATLKGFVTYRKAPLKLFDGAGNSMSAILPFDNGKSTADLYFVPTVTAQPDGSKVVDFAADLKDGKKVDVIYKLPADNYMMQCNIVLTGIGSDQRPLRMMWATQYLSTEKDMANERMNSQFYYHLKNDDHDYFTYRNEEAVKTPEGTAGWVGFRKQYFSSAWVADDGFGKLEARYGFKTEDSSFVSHQVATLELPLHGAGGVFTGGFRWFIGPNDYKVLSSYNLGLEDMVPLGSGLMAFVKYINKFIFVPFFYLLCGLVTSPALIIFLMTLTIRLILSFFTYKSYVSSAKMRVMKPELDELRAKCGDDNQKFSMEQMKLFKSAGVNPLGGCLPMLFQLPILLAMYNVFPSFLEFRQKSFLWADDLSTYDNILSFHFNIPFYGDHVSLFTLLMTATSLFLALYNRNMTPQDPNNPMMKYMPYIFPFMLMGMFNKMAAALTFYYTLSNLFSIVQQFVIQKYFIDEKAIHAQLQENKTKPVVQSKWAQRIEEMQKVQAQRANQTPKKNGK